MVFGPVRERADPFDPGCIRASMGASFRLKIVETSHREFRSWRHRYELRVLGADGGAPSDHRTVKMNRPLLIMLGSERDGLSEAQRITCDGFVRIPMSAGVDSLNVAMAGTVLLYEAWGQRHPVRRKT
jgi:TrmH family RNA methyltransferase